MENANPEANTIATIKVGVKGRPETLKPYPIKADIPSPSLTFDDIYPVGSVYISTNNIDPNVVFTGTKWERFGEGRCLWGASTSSELMVEKEAALPNIRGKSGSKMTNG